MWNILLLISLGAKVVLGVRKTGAAICKVWYKILDYNFILDNLHIPKWICTMDKISILASDQNLIVVFSDINPTFLVPARKDGKNVFIYSEMET